MENHQSSAGADPYHLVSLGTTGEGHCGLVGADYQYVHAGAVDICEYHDYSAAPETAPRVNLCAGLQKPKDAPLESALELAYDEGPPSERPLLPPAACV